MVALSVIQKVDNARLMKATEGLTSGAYTVTLTQQDKGEIRGFVANGDAKEYGVVLTEGQAFCGCKDAIYRKVICKHAVALALYAIRNPKAEFPTEGEQKERPVNLTLAKTRPDWQASA